jgi:DNA-binding NarL/FixJ family response regulator
LKILIVDDNYNERKNIVSVFKNNEDNLAVNISEADNDYKAENLLGELNPNVAIIDLNIGGSLNGIQLLQKIKNNNKNTKIILLLSDFSKEEFNQAEKIGIDGYIFKDAEAKDIKYIYDLIKLNTESEGPLIIGYISN